MLEESNLHITVGCCSVPKCISGLPSFLWPRFPLTRNKPVGGHAPTVISSKGCECAVRKGDVGVLKF
ncbi:hypothetical protein OUZ56_014816 [Daphnia magna]|uniref:Uncharacterized protein n=1 Tax=Daphnia magna TaxID=35525 RepID=A0ABR0AKX7_9CRUS|nr:hypothetical protein OUZ56_014816 [Daphnia magna]